ncbi:serine/threonine-protein kinase [Merismopedia glauca]|uniref:Protein kinase n=1 Tax=Merismopedia glauca CCAP 1448/3 TaxID=1296344 RepID=A0A2T1BZ49_9CYAN|nr:serine/threonine-protein kinase [Merismopedia glauca]PSB01143.1 protein kinase [Merismopedia glauca CCAP 1448/3]
MVGRVLDGRYRIVHKLGQGGFAETYLAEDIRVMNRQVVVKHLKPSSNNPDLLREAKQLFAQEAEVLANLGREHPQIPDMLAYFEENQEFYLVQEFVHGKTLSEEIASTEKLTEAEALKILREVLLVLKFVHENQVIHRDIKPSNLMRRYQDGKIVLIDFGAVKQLSAMVVNTEGQPSVTRIIGSPGYMANEQQSGRPRFSSDIYALGVTIIQALTGLNLEQLKLDRQTGELDWQQGVQVNQKLAAILDKMVRFNFADRYQSVDEVLQDLDKLLPPTSNKLPSWLHLVKSSYIYTIPALLLVIAATLLLPRFLPSTEKATDFLQQGDRLIELQKYDEALTAFDRALQKQPDSIDAWNGKGTALLKLNKYDLAIAAFEKSTTIDPKSFAAWLHKGEALTAIKNYTEASQAFKEAWQIQPQSFEALNKYGLTLLLLDNHSEALDIYEKALKIKQDDPETWFYQGIALGKLQRYSAALASFDKALQIKPDYGKALVGKGLALNGLNKYQQAIAFFNQAIEIQPDLSEAWLGKGKALQALAQHNEALYAFEQTLKTAPDNPEIWNLKGESLLQLGKYKDALVAFEEAVRLKPDFQKARDNEALARQRLK